MVVQSVKMWTCHHCSRVFQTYLQKQRHRRVHSSQNRYWCPVKLCTKSFRTLSEYQEHRRKHNDRRLYSCQSCQSRFLSRSHLHRHKCGISQTRLYHCHICSSSFLRHLSLSHHLITKHLHRKRAHPMLGAKLVKKKLSLKNRIPVKIQPKEGKEPDGDKILLKIRAGKSMTIISPMKPSSESKEKLKKKSKKKHKKDLKESRKNGIILSIRNGSVNLPFEKSSEIRNDREKRNGLKTCRVVEKVQESNKLKLKIKTCADTSAKELDLKKSVIKMSKKSSSLKSSKKYKRQLLDDEILNQEVNEIKADTMNKSPASQKNSESKIRNGIVILKDKSGKLQAEQLALSKSRRRDRENVFDSFSDIDMWKVMPSPRTDSPHDGLKLKLSPQKPLKHESGLDIVFESASSKCLDAALKSRTDASGDDSDIFEALPVEGKESESPINNVNDSGIEVLSSSSCNRSNGNSVRSLILDENSPTYFNTEDSLLSLDSPMTEALNKSEHTICHKCGGVIMEANNNTGSPGKCRCSVSNPNSPFQTPVSPVKSSSHVMEHTKTHEHVLDNDPYKLKVDCPAVSGTDHTDSDKLSVKSNDKSSSSSKDSYKLNEHKIGDDSDIIVIPIEDKVNASSSSKLKLKLRPKNSSAVVKKDNFPDPSFETTPNYTVAPESRKSVTETSGDLGKLPIDKSSAIEVFTSLKAVPDISTNNIVSPVIVVSDETGENRVSKRIETSKDSDSVEKKVKKKPLFKAKKTSSTKNADKCDENDSGKRIDTIDVDDKKSSCKKPLFKKRTSVPEIDKEDPECVVHNKKPIFKKRNLSLRRSVSCTLTSNNEEEVTPENEEKVIEKDMLDDTEISVDESSTLLDSKMYEKSKSSSKEMVHSKSHVITKTELKCESKSKSSKSSELPPKDCVPERKCEQKRKSQKSVSNVENVDTNKKSEDKSKKERKVSDTTKGSVKKKMKSCHSVLSKEEDDSLDQLSKIKEEPPSVIPKPATSTDSSSFGFYQQFLSFISKSKPANIKPVDAHKNKVEEKKKSPSRSEISGSLTEFGFSDGEKSDDGKKGGATDSFSWLKIFSEKETNSNQKKDAEKKDSKNDVEFGEDLAAIKEKMVSVDDEDSNSLDVDEVFESKILSSLEPKAETVDRTKLSNSGHSSVHNSAKRPQTAKRSSGRFKRKRREHLLDSDSSTDLSSDSDGMDYTNCIANHKGDPDFDPFFDSEDDFMPSKPIRKRDRNSRTSRTRRLSSESFCNESSNVTESQISRSKRSKQGRKSCCPCCLGSPKKGKREHESDIHDSYRLPRRHKMFVRSSIRLLQLQEKIHTLFLTLFPDCVDIVSKSKAGTEEFEALIDDVLFSLEGEECSFEPMFTPDSHTTQPCEKSQENFSHVDQLNLVYPTTQGHLLSGTHAVEEIKTAGDSTTQLTSDPLPLEYSKHNSESNINDLEKPGPGFAGGGSRDASFVQVDLDHGSCEKRWQTDDKFSPTDESMSLAASINSTNYLAVNAPNVPAVWGNPACRESAIDDKQYQGNSAETVHNPLTAGDDSSLQTDLVITIDLNAARVSLCRDPKDCLHRLQNRIARLIHLFLPKLELKRSFYKNIDNMETLVDLMIRSNTGVDIEYGESSEDENMLSDTVLDTSDFSYPLLDVKKVEGTEGSECLNKFGALSQENPYDFEELSVTCPNQGKEVDSLCENSGSIVKRPDDRVPVLSKYQEKFEQEIKNQRENLKKVVFESDNEDFSSVNKSPEDLLNSIQLYNKLAKSKRKARDYRPRKRSAEEKRTLFVQEKIMNNHNSTIVCNDKTKKQFSDLKPRAGKRTKSRNPKKRFLSELNLGTKRQSLSSKKSKDKPDKDPVPGDACGTEQEVVTKDELEDIEEEDADGHRKSGDKNIFELLQPSKNAGETHSL